jgi:hypothetical protein
MSIMPKEIHTETNGCKNLLGGMSPIRDIHELGWR